MKLLFFMLISFCYGFFTPVSGQTPQSTPSQAEANRQREEAARQNEQRIRSAQEFERLKSLSNQVPNSQNSVRGNVYQSIELLYRNPSEKELKLVAPEKEDLMIFADFLRQPNTGLIKLAEDRGCAENTNIIVANSDCLAYTMPGAGNSYSFRVRGYRIARLADITFTKNYFQSTGIYQHGFFVELGAIPLEKVNLQTKGVEFLVDFKSEPNFQKARELDLQLIKGITEKGFSYRRSIEAKDNVTYALRSVAYRGKYLRAVQDFTYDELAFDKRNDVIIAFRVIRRDSDGAITILWKQLAKQDSPTIKLNKVRRTDENKKSSLVAQNK